MRREGWGEREGGEEWKELRTEEEKEGDGEVGYFVW